MWLLVSVRSASEARAALAGGADIIDAKEPGRGPLGAVDLPVLREIAATLPPEMRLSVALGDSRRPHEAAVAVSAAAALLATRRAAAYLKLGFQGLTRVSDVEAVLGAAVAAAGPIGVVAAAYADHAIAPAPDPFEILEVARAARTAGVLLDTWTKDGRTVLDWLPEAELRRWVTTARRSHLLAAVAGSIDLDLLPTIRDCSADIVGIRGAACVAGRGGTLEAARVAALKDAVDPMRRTREVTA